MFHDAGAGSRWFIEVLHGWKLTFSRARQTLAFQMSDVLKPLHLKVVFGRKYRFQNVGFSQVAEAPRKVRGRDFSIMYSRKLRGRATIQSRKQQIVVFLHARKRKQTSIPFLNPRKRRGSDSLFKPLAEGTFHPAQGPRKPTRKGFDISLRPQLSLEHCSDGSWNQT